MRTMGYRLLLIRQDIRLISVDRKDPRISKNAHFCTTRSATSTTCITVGNTQRQRRSYVTHRATPTRTHQIVAIIYTTSGAGAGTSASRKTEQLELLFPLPALLPWWCRATGRCSFSDGLPDWDMRKVRGQH